MSPRQKESSSEFLRLKRRQLDAQLHPDAPVGGIEAPPHGWVYTIRTALGMTQSQLARRLGVSTNSISTLEKREAKGTASIGRLESAAHALGCDLRVAFVPRIGLQRAVEDQAGRKASKERERIVHTMRLEAQDTGVEQALADDGGADAWLTTRAREIWD